jgi:DnaJ-class molecular chaperone
MYKDAKETIPCLSCKGTGKTTTSHITQDNKYKVYPTHCKICKGTGKVVKTFRIIKKGAK